MDYMNIVTESDRLSNEPPTEPGWYWVATNPAWRDRPEVVLVACPEYEDRLYVFSTQVGANILLLEEFCKKFPRRWMGKLDVPKVDW